jgi:hypothetical protein
MPLRSQDFRWAIFLLTLLACWGRDAFVGAQNPWGERYPLRDVIRQEFDQQVVTYQERLPPPKTAAETLPPPTRLPPVDNLPPAAAPEPATALPAAPAEQSSHTVDTHGLVPHFEPELGCGAYRSTYLRDDFSADPINYQLQFDPCREQEPYDTKKPVHTQRPWIEWGRPFYDYGPFPPSSTLFGRTNLSAPQFLVYGDFRSAIASRQTGVSNNQIASRLNLEADLKLTSTERLHTSMQPLNRNGNFTRVDFNSEDAQFEQAFNANLVTGFLEADLGAVWGGLTGRVLPFELPFAVGSMPLLFQNGIWLDDNVIGVAATLPAKNSAALDIPNFDVTFFYLFDNIDSPAFGNDNSASKAYGVASFLDVAEGYIELDYAFLEDRSAFGRSYHNVGISYTRRYAERLSNSVRLLSNLGQSPQGVANSAEGLLLLVENSLITADPYLFVPYFNFFAGFRQPQSVARGAAAGGVLRNTGILFESDNLTGYPTLDATGNEAFGGAFGLNMIPGTINQQLVLEYAFVNVMDDVALRKAVGNQQGLGMRYQRNLSHSWLLRADAMYGFLNDTRDLSGVRLELRNKF